MKRYDMTFDETTFKHDETTFKRHFNMGYYLNMKRKINMNTNMTQRLDKNKNWTEKRFEAQTWWSSDFFSSARDFGVIFPSFSIRGLGMVFSLEVRNDSCKMILLSFSARGVDFLFEKWYFYSLSPKVLISCCHLALHLIASQTCSVLVLHSKASQTCSVSVLHLKANQTCSQIFSICQLT